MTKVILSILISTFTVYAYTAKVEKDSVTITVNEVNQSYQVGNYFKLNAGDLVCFVSGKGKVVIKSDTYTKKLSKRSSSCKKLPTGKQDSKNYIAALSNNIKTTFTQAEENIVAGASVRDINVTILDKNVYRRPITISKSTKYFTIANDQTKNRPITIQILDDKGRIIAEDVNKKDVKTFFLFPVSVVKDGYTIKVVDGFYELLMESKVVWDF